MGGGGRVGGRREGGLVVVPEYITLKLELILFDCGKVCHKWTKGHMNSNHASVIHEPQ